MQTFARNVWGLSGSTEPQRSDLWIIDLSDLIRTVRSWDTSSNTPGLPSEGSDHFHYAQSVSFPPVRVSQSATPVDSARMVMFPGYDEPVGAVRLVFYQDTAANKRGSKILHLLSIWRALVRIGRDPSIASSASGSIPTDPRDGLGLPDDLDFFWQGGVEGGFRYRFDLPVWFYQGIQNRGGNWDDTITMKPAAGYRIGRAWLSSIQPSEITYVGGSTLVTLQTELFPETISEILPEDFGKAPI